MVPEWEEDKYITRVIGIVVFLGALILGVFANTLALNFFWKSIRNNVFSQIFCAVSLTDLLTSILALFVGLCYLQERQPGPFGDVIFRETWGSLWNFTSRYSVYLVAVLSITRTVRILMPFTAIKIRAVQASLVLYAAWLICTTPTFYGVPHYYKAEWCALGLNKSQFVRSSAQELKFKYYIIVMSIPAMLLIPIPLTFISALASLYKIIVHRREHKNKVPTRPNINRFRTIIAQTEVERSAAEEKGKARTKDSSFQSGMTIALITVIYLVLNIPHGVIYLYVQTTSHRLSVPAYAVIKENYVKSYVIGVSHILSIALNAALNPLLLFLRIKDFREHVNHLLPHRGGRLRRQTKHLKVSSDPGPRPTRGHFSIVNSLAANSESMSYPQGAKEGRIHIISDGKKPLTNVKSIEITLNKITDMPD